MEIINQKLIREIEIAINNFYTDEPLIEIAFAKECTESTLIVIITLFDSYLLENEIEEFLLETLNKNKDLIDDKNKFSIRFVDKETFLFSLNNFDPDVISLLDNNIQVVYGEKKFKELFQSIEVNKLADSNEVLSSYFDDSTSSFLNLNDKIIEFEIQLNRTLLNYLKLIYVIKNHLNSKVNLWNLAKHAGITMQKDILKSIDFFPKDNPKYNTQDFMDVFYKSENRDIQRKIELINYLIVNFNKWVIQIIDDNNEKLKPVVILKWIKNIFITTPEEFHDGLIESLYPYLKALELEQNDILKNELNEVFELMSI